MAAFSTIALLGVGLVASVAGAAAKAKNEENARGAAKYMADQQRKAEEARFNELAGQNQKEKDEKALFDINSAATPTKSAARLPGRAGTILTGQLGTPSAGPTTGGKTLLGS